MFVKTDSLVSVDKVMGNQHIDRYDYVVDPDMLVRDRHNESEQNHNDEAPVQKGHIGCTPVAQSFEIGVNHEQRGNGTAKENTCID